MSWDYETYGELRKLIKIANKDVELQGKLLKAFNAQTAAIERQNELQEKMLVALNGITNNTAPKVKHVTNNPKQKKSFS